MVTLYCPRYTYQNGSFYTDYAVAAENGIIATVGKREQLSARYPGAETADWQRLILLPGTVNAHNHSFQSMLRGLSCDRPFLEWRDNTLYHFSSRFQPEDIYGAALFAFGEMVKYGVTTVCDFFYLHTYGVESDEMIIRAAKDVGIRLVLARTMYDWQGAPSGYVETVAQAESRTRALAKAYADDPMVSVVPAPHSLHAATPEMILAGHALAGELGCRYHIHVAEEPFEVEQVQREHNGLTPVEYLDTLGVVDSSMVLVHGVWLKPEEIDLLGARKANLAYCPSSNMFLADGVTDLPRMMRAGVTVGLGSDGACSNNRISVFEEMRMATLLQKAVTHNAACVHHRDAFQMGTQNGADLLQLHTGRIEAGYAADFVGIDAEDLSMQPIGEAGEQLLPNIVYSMQPSAVREVVIGGSAVIHAGQHCTVTEAQLLDTVQRTLRSIGG